MQVQPRPSLNEWLAGSDLNLWDKLFFLMKDAYYLVVKTTHPSTMKICTVLQKTNVLEMYLNQYK